jgi:histidinol-phosphate aminotransferase
MVSRQAHPKVLSDYFVPALRDLESNRAYLEHLSVVSRDRSLIRLASNENLEPPCPAVLEAVARAAHLANHYPPTNPPLQHQLAERHAVSTESVLLGAGASEVIDAVIRAFVARGEEVILSTPTWPVYRKRLVAVEAAIREVRLSVEGMSFIYDVNAMSANVSPHTKLVIVCTPNNPTGNILTREELRALAGLGCPILVDSAYDDFTAAADRLGEVGAGELVKGFSNVVVARTFSKSYALAGLRVGYLLGAPPILEHIERMMLPSGGISNVALAAGEAALENADYAAVHVARLVSERHRVTKGLREAGFVVFESFGNFVPVSVEHFFGGSASFARQLLERKIAVRAMSENLVRITVGRAHENDALLDAVRNLGGNS